MNMGNDMTQEEWNLQYEMSRFILEKFLEVSNGIKLCPAHAQRIIQLCQDKEMKDWSENPGRKDG
jgi:hypothetical protein